MTNWLQVICKATVFEDLVTLTHIQTINPACFKGGKHWLLHGVTQSLSLLSLRLNAKRQQNRKRTLCGFDLWNGVSYIISHLEHWQILTHYFGLLIQMSVTYTWPWCDCDRFSKLRSVINPVSLSVIHKTFNQSVQRWHNFFFNASSCMHHVEIHGLRVALTLTVEVRTVIIGTSVSSSSNN